MRPLQKAASVPPFSWVIPAPGEAMRVGLRTSVGRMAKSTLRHFRSHLRCVHVPAEPDCTVVRTGFLTPEQMADLRRQGAVGDILMRYFDAFGRRVPTPLESRIISPEWEDIRRIPHVVVMAAGPTKVEPILGALRGGFCHCLITDTETAEQALQRVEGDE